MAPCPEQPSIFVHGAHVEGLAEGNCWSVAVVSDLQLLCPPVPTVEQRWRGQG